MELRMLRNNEITLFSNGIAHFRRVYNVKGEKTISIPFKKENLDDAAASFQVFGKVKIVKQPAFTPINSNATSLKIDPENAYVSILQKASGAKFTLNKNNFLCTLFGVCEEQIFVNDTIVDKLFIVYKDNEGIKKLSTSEVMFINFQDDAVNSEIEKALRCNFQSIKPDSTLVDVTISSLEDDATDVVVQYTIPVAAWKTRYAIRQNGNNFVLEGSAIIDNNTDEEWNDFRISVVTGNPISFQTDIASICIPKRKMVNLTDNSLGNVLSVDSSYGGRKSESRETTPISSNLGYKMSTMSLNEDDMACGSSSNYYSTMNIAEAAGVDSKEVGDFCVYTSRELITIPARRSGIVPMFSVALKNAGNMLYYKEKNNATRAFRAIKFKNETEYSLGKGKTIIYNDGVFSGECILDITKPMETKMLPHCLENGVKVSNKLVCHTTERIGFKFQNGAVFDETRSIIEQEYSLENKKNELFKIGLDHATTFLDNSTITASGVEGIKQEKTNDGHRFYFELKPNETAKLVVKEITVFSQAVVINRDFCSLYKNAIKAGGFSENKTILACVAIQEEINKVNKLIKDKESEKAEIVKQMEIIRANLSAAKDVGQNTLVNEWVKDLDVAVKDIKNLEKTIIPSLRSQEIYLKEKLNNTIKEASDLN